MTRERESLAGERESKSPLTVEGALRRRRELGGRPSKGLMLIAVKGPAPSPDAARRYRGRSILGHWHDRSVMSTRLGASAACGLAYLGCESSVSPRFECSTCLLLDGVVQNHAS